MSYIQLNRKKTKIIIEESNETTHQLYGVNVRFPGKPYAPQLSMMSFIIQAITLKKNALLESPTGTGKTLAILCGALAAFQSLPAPAQGFPYRVFYCVRTHSQLAQVVSELAKTSYRARMAVLGARKRYCLNSTALNAEVIEHSCSELRHDQKCGYYNNLKSNMMSFPFPHQPDDVWQMEHLKEFGEHESLCPYYMTSVLAGKAELIICPYQYVLNKRTRKVDIMPNDILIFDEAHNMEDASRDAFTRKLTFGGLSAALADMFSLFHRFPKFVQRYGLVFYMLYFFTQWLMSVEAKEDSVMGMDTIRDGLVPFSLTDQKDVPKLVALNEMIGDDWKSIRKNIIDDNSTEEDIFEVISSDQEQLYANTDQQRRLINVLEFERLNIDKGKFEVNNFFLHNTLDDEETTKHTSIMLRHRSNGCLNMRTTDTLLELIDILREILKEPSDMEVDPVRVSVKNPDDKVLELYSLDPSLIFRPLAKMVHCVILASGTLSPFLSFESELGVTFPLRMEGAHVINPSKQVSVFTLSRSKGGYPLRCIHKETSSLIFQDELGETIYSLIHHIPQGVLCFLPSYTLLGMLRMRWTQTGVWKRMMEIKELFCEPQDVRDFPNTIQKYYVAARKGALMFAIFRGKCSEGMDFTDEKARAVISLGIPLPNFKDCIIDEKMRYNTMIKTVKPSSQRINGTEWYSLQAWRAMNQALGRCIRHIADYGCMILIDARFQDVRPNTSSDCQMLSRWLRKELTHEKSMMVVETKLDKFFEGKESVSGCQ